MALAHPASEASGHQDSRFAPLPTNSKSAETWGRGGREYEAVSRQIADAIEHCVDRLDPQRGERIIDVATGTGWAARRVARRGASVVGVDFAEGVLEVARDLATPGTSFRVADAEALPYPDAAFDAVISTFGVMFCADHEQAAAELARVCKPGGRLALATWSPHGGVASMFEVIRPYLATTPARSPFDWGRVENLRDLLGEDFEVATEEATTYYREESGEAAWQTFVNSYGPTQALASQLGEDDRRRLRQDWVDFHESHRTPLGILVPRPYVITVGRRHA